MVSDGMVRISSALYIALLAKEGSIHANEYSSTIQS